MYCQDTVSYSNTFILQFYNPAPFKKGKNMFSARFLINNHILDAGLCQEGLYQSPGDPARVSLLLEEFTRDARNVKLRNKEHQLEDVTDTLKHFLSQLEDALLTKELYPYWVSALGK